MELSPISTLSSKTLDDKSQRAQDKEIDSLSLKRALSGDTQVDLGTKAGWQNYPFSLASYNPLSEWGRHYERIFRLDFWPDVSEYDMLDMENGVPVQKHISGGQAIDGILNEDPDLRIFYCDSMLCTDGVTRGSFTVEDIKKIFTHYDISIVFLDYFIGRNRPTIGSRKRPNPKNPSEILSYGESTYRTPSSTLLNTLSVIDIWYILPSRIWEEEEDYDCHFILFTVYVHYDCRTHKTVMFYIHRSGSENQASAQRCSRNLKNRVHDALAAISTNASLSHFQYNPFAFQLPTITSSVILWTEALHTERLAMWQKEDEGRANLTMVDTAWLHNVSRYIHSYKTNVLFTQKAIESIRREHTWFAKNLGDEIASRMEDPAYTTVDDCLEAQLWQLDMISTYCDEVVKRMEILIALYFNRISELDSHATANIAAETRRDAVSMRTIAFVTLIFLPGTFVSSFFSMAFFQGSGPIGASKLWMYPMVALPTTALVLACWWIWHRRFQNKSQTDWDAETGSKMGHPYRRRSSVM